MPTAATTVATVKPCFLKSSFKRSRRGSLSTMFSLSCSSWALLFTSWVFSSFFSLYFSRAYHVQKVLHFHHLQPVGTLAALFQSLQCLHPLAEFSDVYHRFSYRTCSLPLSTTYRRCCAGRRVRERKARNTHRIESMVSYPRASRGSDNLHKGSNLNNLSAVTPLNINDHLSSNVTSTNSSLQTNLVVNPRSTFLNFAVFNSRSVRNKIESIIDHVVENDIGLCTITETWLNDADSASIAQLSVAGYFFKHFSRQ